MRLLTGGCANSRVCTESRLWEKKNPCRIGESNPKQYCIWFSGPKRYCQLIYLHTALSTTTRFIAHQSRLCSLGFSVRDLHQRLSTTQHTACHPPASHQRPNHSSTSHCGKDIATVVVSLCLSLTHSEHRFPGTNLLRGRMW